MQMTIIKATPEDNCSYRVEFTIPKGEEAGVGNWFAFANPAELRTGSGWITRPMENDTFAKKDPSVTEQAGYQLLIPGHQGHHWLTLSEQGEDSWRVKFSLGEVLKAGSYMVRVVSRKSKFGDGDYLSGNVEPFEEMRRSEVPATASDVGLAQTVANVTGESVEIGQQVIEPGNPSAELNRLRAENERLKVKSSVDECFPEAQVPSNPAGLPLSTPR